MSWKYSAKLEGPQAKVVGVALPISMKHSIEVANHIRGRSLSQAKRMINDAITQKRAIPFRRFVRDMGHKPGDVRTGRYPVKAAGEILTLLDSAEANARNLGLSVQDLFVAHIAPNEGRRNWKPGRQGRRKSKSTHIEIILKEGVPTKGVYERKATPKKAKPKAAPKPAPKSEAKPEAKPAPKEEPKAEAPKEAPEEKKEEAKEAAPAEQSQ